MSAFTVAQFPLHTRPLGEPPTWTVVVGAADYRCECTGACGRTHRKTEGRCDRTHDQAGVRLIAAPADLALPLTTAAELTPDELHAWCPDCYRMASLRDREAAEQRRRQNTPAPETLFDL